MTTSHIALGTFIMLLASLFPQGTHAYFTTAQSALKIDDTHALFIVEYAFGLKNDVVFMPGVTERGLVWGSKEEKVGYTLRDKNDTVVTGGTVTAAVISKAKRSDGMYEIQSDVAQKLWLVALLETDKGAKAENYKLQVDSLPFYVNTGNKDLDARQLNPSELQYYVTKEVELNTRNY
jgi:hypothetical protein